LPPFPSSLPPLSWQPSSLLLLPPLSPNAVALSAAIAAAVAIAHLSTPQSNGDGVGNGNGSDGYGNEGGR
jgi:hypothetical protein